MKVKQIIAFILMVTLITSIAPLEIFASGTIATGNISGNGASTTFSPGGTAEETTLGYGFFITPSYSSGKGVVDYTANFVGTSANSTSYTLSSGLNNRMQMLGQLYLPNLDDTLKEFQKGALVALNTMYRPVGVNWGGSKFSNAGKIYFMATKRKSGYMDMFNLHRTYDVTLKKDMIGVGRVKDRGNDLEIYSRDSDSSGALYVPDSSIFLLPEDGVAPSGIKINSVSPSTEPIQSILQDWLKKLLSERALPWLVENEAAAEEQWENDLIDKTQFEDKNDFMHRTKTKAMSDFFETTFGMGIGKGVLSNKNTSASSTDVFAAGSLAKFWSDKAPAQEAALKTQARKIVAMLVNDGKVTENVKVLMSSPNDKNSVVNTAIKDVFLSKYPGIGVTQWGFSESNIQGLDLLLWGYGEADNLVTATSDGNYALILSGLDEFIKQLTLLISCSIVSSDSVYLGMYDEQKKAPANVHSHLLTWGTDTIVTSFQSYALRSSANWIEYMSGNKAVTGNKVKFSMGDDPDKDAYYTVNMLAVSGTILLDGNRALYPEDRKAPNFQSNSRPILILPFEDSLETRLGTPPGKNTFFRDKIITTDFLKADMWETKKEGWFYSIRSLVVSKAQGMFRNNDDIVGWTYFGNWKIGGKGYRVNPKSGDLFITNDGTRGNPMQSLKMADYFIHWGSPPPYDETKSFLEGLNLVTLMPPTRVSYSFDTAPPPPVIKKDPEEEPKIYNIKGPQAFFKWAMQVDKATPTEGKELGTYNGLGGGLGELENRSATKIGHTYEHFIAIKTKCFQLWKEWFEGRPARPRIPGEEDQWVEDREGKVGPDWQDPIPSPSRPDSNGLVLKTYARVERLESNPETEDFQTIGNPIPNDVNFVPFLYVHSVNEGGANTHAMGFTSGAAFYPFLDSKDTQPISGPKMSVSEKSQLGKIAFGSGENVTGGDWGSTANVFKSYIYDEAVKNDTLGATVPDPVPVVHKFQKAYVYKAKSTIAFNFVGTAVKNIDSGEFWVTYTDTDLEAETSDNNYVYELQYENSYVSVTLPSGGSREEREITPIKWIGWQARVKPTPIPEIPHIEQFSSKAESFSEFKQGSPENETWEAMAGVPTTESLYYSIGGSVFVIDMTIINHAVMANSNHSSDGGIQSIEEDHDLEGRITRKYSWVNPVVACHHNPHIECGPDNVGYVCDHGTGHGMCSVVTGTNEDGSPQLCGASHPAPLHSICNVHSSGYSHTWTNWITNAQYIQIKYLNIWKLEMGLLEGMEKLVLKNGNKSGSKERLESDRDYYTELQAQPFTEVESDFFWNIAEDDLSKYGRVHYSFEPQMFDEVFYTGPTDDHCELGGCGEHSGHCMDTESQGAEDEQGNWSRIYDIRQTITVMSDTVVLRTPEGDIPVLYYEQQLFNVPVALKTHVLWPGPEGLEPGDDGRKIYHKATPWYTGVENGDGSKTPVHQVVASDYHSEGSSKQTDGFYYPLTVDPSLREQWYMPDVTYAEMWNDNPWAIKSWLKEPTFIDTISYDGNYQEATKGDQTKKYETTIKVPKLDFDKDVKFGNGCAPEVSEILAAPGGVERRKDNYYGWCTDASVFEDGVGVIKGKVTDKETTYQNVLGIPKFSALDTVHNTLKTYEPSPGRHYVPKATKVIIQHPSMEIGLRLSNGEYNTGNSHAMYRAMLNYKLKDAVYSVDADTKHFDTMIGFEIESGYTKGVPKINNVILHDPVSVQYSFPHTLPNSRDQRMVDTSPIMLEKSSNSPYIEYEAAGSGSSVTVGDKQFSVAGFYNIDWGAQYYFPNIGDFDKGQPYALKELTKNTGWSYTGVPGGGDYSPGGSGMSTSDWLQMKWVTCSFDVIFEGKMYLAGENIIIYERGRDYYSEVDDIGWVNRENFRFYIPLHNNEQAPGTITFWATGINSPHPSIVRNGDKLNVNRVDYGRKFGAHHDAVMVYDIDLVGRVGNLTMEHVTDPVFEPLFKQAINEDSNYWRIKNLIPNVDLLKPFRYIGQTVDIRKVPIDYETIGYEIYDGLGNQYVDSGGYNTNTYGTIPNRSGSIAGSVAAPLEFPLVSGKNQWSLTGKDYPYANRAEEVLLGYNALLDFATIGNYDTGKAQIVPHWYFVDLDTNQWIPVDVYDKLEGRYKLIYRFGLADNQSQFQQHYNTTSLLDSSITRNPYIIDWEEEESRRNMALGAVKSIYNSLIYLSPSSLASFNASLPASERLTLADMQMGPQGRNNSVGTSQIISLNPYFSRTYFGSTSTYDTFNNPGNRVSEVSFIKKAQLWNWSLGLPATAIPVISADNTNWSNKTSDPPKSLLEGLDSRNGVLVCTVEINVAGDIWTLEYKPERFVYDFTVWKPDAKTTEVSGGSSSGEKVPSNITNENNYPGEPYTDLKNVPGEWVTVIVPTTVTHGGSIYRPRNEHIIMTVEHNKRSIDSIIPSGTH